MAAHRLFACGIVLAALLGATGCSGDSTTPDEQLVIYGSASAPPSEDAPDANARYTGRPSFDVEEVTDSAGVSRLDIVMYALYLSKSPDCSDPILVRSYGTEGQVKDFAGNPMLFEAEPEAGTYPCVIFRMSDVLRMAPDRAFGPCELIEYTRDVYREGETDWVDEDGNPIIGHGTLETGGAVNDRVAVFFTTDTSAALARGINTNQIGELANPLVAPGQSTLYWDMSGAVRDEGGLCSIEPRPMAFR